MDVKVMPRDTVKVVATSNAQYMVPGKEYELHKVAAQKLIDKGAATLKN